MKPYYKLLYFLFLKAAGNVLESGFLSKTINRIEWSKIFEKIKPH